MALFNDQNLKYGVVYIYFDPLYETASTDLHVVDFIRKIAHPFKVEVIPEAGRGKDNTLLVARRFNVGNMGHYATVSLRTSDSNRRGVQFDALHKFRSMLFEIADGNEGDIKLDENDFVARYFDAWSDSESIELAEPPKPCAAPQDHTRVEKNRKAHGGRVLFENLKEKLQGLIKDEDDDEEPTQSLESVSMGSTAKAKKQRLDEDERDEFAAIERERARALEQIKRHIVNYIARYHDDPKELMEQLLIGKVIVDSQCRVTVNGDMKIVLPEYDEMEIKMPAMSRTLYILFMKLRKQGTGGIVLKNIDEYRNDIIDIYSMVKPGADEDRVAQSVDNLCDPFGDSLNQTISRINRCIKSVIIDKQLCQQYLISGTRGGEYSIALNPELMQLPRAVTEA